jgi:hypothetical protein
MRRTGALEAAASVPCPLGTGFDSPPSRPVLFFGKRKKPPLKGGLSKVQSVDQRTRLECGVGFRQLRKCRRTCPGQLWAATTGLTQGSNESQAAKATCRKRALSCVVRSRPSLGCRQIRFGRIGTSLPNVGMTDPSLAFGTWMGDRLVGSSPGTSWGSLGIFGLASTPPDTWFHGTSELGLVQALDELREGGLESAAVRRLAMPHSNPSIDTLAVVISVGHRISVRPFATAIFCFPLTE